MQTETTSLVVVRSQLRYEKSFINQRAMVGTDLGMERSGCLTKSEISWSSCTSVSVLPILSSTKKPKERQRYQNRYLPKVRSLLYQTRPLQTKPVAWEIPTSSPLTRHNDISSEF